MSTSKPRKGYRTCQKCKRNRAERFFKPRGRVCQTCRMRRTKFASREVRLMETYHLTLAEYDELLANQLGVCFICQGKRPYNLDVDHDHQMEKVLLDGGYGPNLARRLSIRGLLCKQCNRRLLPSARDDKAVLQRAIAYLAHPPAFNVIENPLRAGLAPTVVA